MARELVNYRSIFENAKNHLERKGISVLTEIGSTVSPAQFDDFEQRWDVSFPSALEQFYLETGNGLEFRWFLNRSDPKAPFCWLKIPDLSKLQHTLEYLRMLNDCLGDHDFIEHQDQSIGRKHYQRQLSFFPFLNDNADLICIETASGKQTVVFHDHEWSFQEDGDSAILLANSLSEFWLGWSSVGFVRPKCLWWPHTIGEKGVIWSEDNFGFHLDF